MKAGLEIGIRWLLGVVRSKRLKARLETGFARFDVGRCPLSRNEGRPEIGNPSFDLVVRSQHIKVRLRCAIQHWSIGAFSEGGQDRGFRDLPKSWSRPL
jgi:hypothetical protein